MPRTTDSAVQGIIEHDATISLTPFIEIANLMVTDHCTGSSYSTAKLELIERWLSAHFYAIRDPRVTSEGAGSVRETKQVRLDLGLQVTTYGQQVLRLDSAGNLAALELRAKSGRKATGGVSWLGKGDSEGNDDTT